MSRIKFGCTQRGFIIGKFTDINDRPCTIQQSSLATECALWLGQGDNRMHLDEETVIDLVWALKKWLATDELPLPPDYTMEAEQTAANSESAK